MISFSFARFEHAHSKPGVAWKFYQDATLQIALRGWKRAVYFEWAFQ